MLIDKICLDCTNITLDYLFSFVVENYIINAESANSKYIIKSDNNKQKSLLIYKNYKHIITAWVEISLFFM